MPTLKFWSPASLSYTKLASFASIVHRSWYTPSATPFTVPKWLIGRFQTLQNTAVRLVTRTRKWEHITQFWKRVTGQYKCNTEYNTNYYQSLNGSSPSYLIELITPYHPTISLSSEIELLLTIPRMKTTYGDLDFNKASDSMLKTLRGVT